MAVSRAAKPDDLLETLPPAIRKLTEAARRFVRRHAPSASEHVYLGWRGFGYRDPQSGYFCGVFPRHDHVRLLFEHGAALADPEELLEGTTRQVRWVVLASERDLERPGIRELIHAALVFGAA